MLYIAFNAPIKDETINRLLKTITDAHNEGEKELTLLFNTPGGAVSNGITAHNIFRMIPMKKIFWNIGNIDSIGVMMFLAGDERYCIPHSRFLLHDLARTIFKAPASFSENEISLWITEMKKEREAIASLIAEATKQTIESITTMMKNGTILSHKEAKELGFVQDEKRFVLPEGAKLITIIDEKPNQ